MLYKHVFSNNISGPIFGKWFYMNTKYWNIKTRDFFDLLLSLLLYIISNQKRWWRSLGFIFPLNFIKVHCVGQIIGGVVAENKEIAQRAAKLVKIMYEQIDAIITIEVNPYCIFLIIIFKLIATTPF